MHPPDQGISTDELVGISGLSAGQMRKALNDLEALGIASNDTAITIFVHLGVEDSSEKRLKEANSLENDLIDKLRELAPDLELGAATLNLRSCVTGIARRRSRNRASGHRRQAHPWHCARRSMTRQRAREAFRFGNSTGNTFPFRCSANGSLSP
jgi:hypothetical protein